MVKLKMKLLEGEEIGIVEEVVFEMIIGLKIMSIKGKYLEIEKMEIKKVMEEIKENVKVEGENIGIVIKIIKKENLLYEQEMIIIIIEKCVVEMMKRQRLGLGMIEISENEEGEDEMEIKKKL